MRALRLAQLLGGLLAVAVALGAMATIDRPTWGVWLDLFLASVATFCLGVMVGLKVKYP